MAYHDPYYGINSYVGDDEAQRQLDEDERRRREEEAARAELGQPKSTTIVNNDDGTQTVKTTHEIDPAAAGPVAPGSFDSFGNPVEAGSAAATQADPTGQVAAYQEQVRQQQLAQAEEQRRRAAAEAAANAAAEQPAPAAQAAQAAPVSVAPTPMPAPAVSAQPAARGPMTPEAVAALQRQSESAGNYNVGAHYKGTNPASSAWGAYGMTDAARQDAMKLDPSLNKPLSQWTPQDQDRAFQLYNGQNTKRLNQLGVDMNQYPGAPALAAFLGADGAARYINTGEISDAAARANGGLDKARAIADKRLGQQIVPTSGAAQAAPMAPTTPTAPSELQPGTVPNNTVTPVEVGPPAWRDLNDAVSKENIKTLAEGMASQDPALRRASGEALDSMLGQKKGITEAAKKLAAIQKDPKGPLIISKELSKKPGEDGSYMKMFLYQLMNWTGLAKDEAIKLGMGTKYETGMRTNSDTGETEYGLVKVDGRGTPLSGIKADGTDMAPEELIQFASQGASKPKLNAAQHQAIVNGEVHTFSTRQVGNTTQYHDDTAGGGWSTKAPSGFTTMGQVNQATLARNRLGDSAFKQSQAADESENRKQTAQGLNPLYTSAEIQARAQAKRDAIIGLGGTAGTEAAPVATSVSLGAPVSGTGSATAAPIAAIAPGANAGAAPATQLSSTLEAQAQAIAAGDVKMPTGMGASNRVNQAIRNRVYEINPGYDPTVFDNRAKTKTSFTTGKQGDTVRSMNVAIDHLDTLQEAGTALGNGQIPIFNKVAQEFAKNTGQTAPTTFDGIKTIVGAEVAKAIQGGATALGDREEIRAELDKAKTPQQLSELINKYQKLLGGQLTGLHTQFISGGGKENEWTPKLNPRTQKVLGQGGAVPAVPAPYSDADKEARYQEYLKKRNAGK